MGQSKEVQAKKPTKGTLVHNARPTELPTTVDWGEQERLQKSLKAGFIPKVVSIKEGSHYTPDVGTELCLLRRQGYSGRKVCEQTHTDPATLRSWLNDFPEFSQEWDECYREYLLAVTEEIVPHTESILLTGKFNGKKLSKVQFNRVLKILELHAREVHWAAARRIPELYGDDDTGSELVLVQPMNIPERSITQAPDQAAKYAEDEDGTDSGESPDEPEPGTGDDDRSGGSSGTGQAESDGSPVSTDVGRDQGSSSRVPESNKPLTDEIARPEGDRGVEGNADPDSPEQRP